MPDLLRRVIPLLFGCVAAYFSACVPAERPDPGGLEDCGGLAGIACESGEFCDYPPSARCGAADQTGSCTVVPRGCTKEYVPVCGCDGKTYGNACTARAAQVSVAAPGECTKPGDGKVCGGLVGAGCPTGQFCSYPLDAQCGAADQTGTCAIKPEACTLQYDPVCGCDDKTYGNACGAAGAGVSIAHDGPC